VPQLIGTKRKRSDVDWDKSGTHAGSKEYKKWDDLAGMESLVREFLELEEDDRSRS